MAALIGAALLFPLGFRAKLGPLTIFSLCVLLYVSFMILESAWDRSDSEAACASLMMATYTIGFIACLRSAVKLTPLPLRLLKWLFSFGAALLLLAFLFNIGSFQALLMRLASPGSAALFSSLLLPPALTALVLWRADRPATAVAMPQPEAVTPATVAPSKDAEDL